MLNPFVNLVNRRMCIRVERLNRSTYEVLMADLSGEPHDLLLDASDRPRRVVDRRLIPLHGLEVLDELREVDLATNASGTALVYAPKPSAVTCGRVARRA